jgi:hypothetical protein
MLDANRDRLLKKLNKSGRLDKYGSEKKKIINRIMKDLDDSEVFSPILFKDVYENDYVEEQIRMTKEELIKKKEEELAAMPELKIRKRRKKRVSKSGLQRNFCHATKYGYSPLHTAIEEKNIKEITILADKKMYLFEINNDGDIPYKMAMFNDYQEAMDVIKKNMDEILEGAQNG